MTPFSPELQQDSDLHLPVGYLLFLAALTGDMPFAPAPESDDGLLGSWRCPGGLALPLDHQIRQSGHLLCQDLDGCHWLDKSLLQRCHLQVCPTGLSRQAVSTSTRKYLVSVKSPGKLIDAVLARWAITIIAAPFCTSPAWLGFSKVKEKPILP